MVVDGVSVDVATLTRHGSLMPAGIYGQPPVFFGLDPTHVFVGLKDSAGTGQTIAAIVCEVPAGRCQKVPKPSFGILG